ncbi:Eco57I restriction-modification methylase domain-containing protein [Pseudonocardia broussonetiae]|uniref:Eco57I restriction-modification methylase domain-containing protein n=1 Tax=Pseudonocardia broussonetiae TaxID=2736640 RepID=UPI0019654066|nr:class I SAM-dependent DNA methyltransferase [Pseudonocardia broussonetiae]
MRALRADWKDREEHTKATPRSGLTGLGAKFGSLLVQAREQRSEKLLRTLHDAVRQALQLDGPEVEVGELAVPAVVRGEGLLVLQARDAMTVEDVLDGDGAGHLLGPATVDGKPETTTSRVLSALFGAETPPALVVVTAGAWVLLAERSSWPEGRWLAVDLATALERHDTRAAGELETIAALVSADALLPRDDGSVLLLTLLEESVKHAVGVSKDLRGGVRESIELLATDVLRRRAELGLPSDVDGLAPDLTRQSLRFLYRILFLLYAEARPELGVLPVGTSEYAEGYGLDRLRELVLTDLTSDAAERGTHLYDSLRILFRLVNDGYPPETLGADGVISPADGPADAPSAGADDGGELRFEALRADLFSADATALIDEVGLGNRCLQQVLARLLLSPERRGRDRGFVSYAQLGINQLGAVYEGLMSYTGSIATRHLVEVARDGDPSKGSWVVPEEDTREFDPRWFVERVDPETDVSARVRYAPGDFVYRLSGRDRQRSASYYTPEVLTRCVVTHSLAELFTDDTPAADVLDVRVCEPALGSGAFLVEAVDQLADQYLTRRQRELGDRIDPEDVSAQKQRVKAYIALHNCYGVDLNSTAVELAEITLWLDAMHPGLRAPWFGLHLRRGNSLIGARRETWTPADIAKGGWLTTVPTPRPLGSAVSPYEVHHFLLPAAGWGAVADTKEAKEGRPAATDTLKKWRRSNKTALSKTELARLQALGQRVETLWTLAQRRLEVAEREIRRDIPIWGAADLPSGTGAVQREQIEASLTDPASAYRRLRRVMDAWAALWFWPVTTSVALPTRAQWIDACEMLLGVRSKAEAKLGRGLFADAATWPELDDAEQSEISFTTMRPVDEVLAAHPWLGVCAGIAEREGFFHWEFDFAPVFAERGGFDLQLGNPPWVRPDWDDNLVLAEDDAWFGLADKPGVTEVRERREQVLDDGDVRYLDERASLAGTSAHLGSAVDRPVLAGLRPDLYRCFMDRTWRSMGDGGIVGLIHPESHFTEAAAGRLRRHTYSRLRRHWQFRNERKLFEIGNTREFGLHVYAAPGDPDFLNAAALYVPETIDRSFHHDGSGPEPGIKDDEDRWDARPHAARLVSVNCEVLATWAALIEEPGTPAIEARMLRPITAASQQVLDKLAGAPRFATSRFDWASGWNEATDRTAGFFISGSAVPPSLDDVIIQGPHLSVANPFYQNPPATYRTFKDYRAVDLEELRELVIPRTNYQRAKPTPDYIAGYPRWGGVPANRFWRVAWRRMADSSTVRTLHAALIPPGPMHVHPVLTLTADSLDLAVAAGMWASLPVDFFAKVGGSSEMNTSVVRRFPHPRDHVLVPDLILRALRLNCLTADYAPLWEELFDPSWQLDQWTRDLPAVPLHEVGPRWTMQTPLRRDAERRQALVEIDALAAVMLGITAEELCAIYRTQFGVLRKYERVMQHDRNGRQVPKDVLKVANQRGADLGRYELPFTPVDREAEMTEAHERFTARMRMREAAHEGFDTGDPDLTAEILRQSRATGYSPGFLHRVNDGSGFRMVEPTPDTSPEAMAVLRAEGVDAWRAFAARQGEPR